VETLVGQRIFGLALGYEDLVDHDELRKDLTLAVLAGKLKPVLRSDCEALAGKSTLNRLEHTPKRYGAKYHKIDCDGAKVDALLVDLFVESHERAPREIVIDLDNKRKRLPCIPLTTLFLLAVAWRTRGEGGLRDSDGIGVARHPMVVPGQTSQPRWLLRAGNKMLHVGQILYDNDPRYSGRTVKVIRIEERYLVCKCGPREVIVRHERVHGDAESPGLCRALRVWPLRNSERF
jgi:hypothetical protein